MTTMLATRVRRLSNLEGFEIEVFGADGTTRIDLKTVGYARYDFEKMARSDWTVRRWCEDRVNKVWPDVKVRVLFGDGCYASEDDLLALVRETYEE